MANVARKMFERFVLRGDGHIHTHTHRDTYTHYKTIIHAFYVHFSVSNLT